MYTTRYGSTSSVACTVTNELRLIGYEINVHIMDKAQNWAREVFLRQEATIRDYAA